MRRGDTPLITISSTDTTFSDYEQITFTLKQGENIVNVYLDEMTLADNIITFRLTQEQTFRLLQGKAKVLVQIRLKDADGVVVGSDIDSFDMSKILNEEVI